MIPNLEDYQAKKAKGLVSLQKIDASNMAIGTKQFSAEDGTELPMQVLGVTVKEVNAAIVAKEAELVDLKAFLADLKMAT